MSSDLFTCADCGWPATASNVEGGIESALRHFVYTGHDVVSVPVHCVQSPLVD